MVPKRFRTSPFACGWPATRATQRGMVAFNQNAAITNLTTTNAYWPAGDGFAKRKEFSFDIACLMASGEV